MGLNATLLGAQLAGGLAQQSQDQPAPSGIPFMPSQAGLAPPPYYVAQPSPQGPGPWAPQPMAGPYSPQLDSATIGSSAPPTQPIVPPAMPIAPQPKSDNEGPFIAGPKSLADANSKPAPMTADDAIDVMSGNAPNVPSRSIQDDLTKAQPATDTNQSRLDALLNSAPKEDPRIQVARDAANELLGKLNPESPTFLAPPKYPGMTIAQALVGIAGAIATQGNPHAQFVSQYMQSLGDAVQKQYGNSLQGWQVAREALKDQASSLLGQAKSLQDYQSEIYKANIGPYGRGLVADMNNQGKLSVAQIQQAGLLQRNLQSNNSRETVAALRDFNNSSASPEQRALAWATVVKLDPRYAQIDPNVVQAGLETPSGKFLLEKAQAQNQGSLADLNAARTETDNITRQAKLDDFVAKAAYDNSGAKLNYAKIPQIEAEAKNWLAKTAALPQQIRNQTMEAVAASTRANAFSDQVRNTGQYQNGMISLGVDKLNVQEAITQAQEAQRAGTSLQQQAVTMRGQAKDLLDSANKLTDAAAIKQATKTAQSYLDVANELQVKGDETYKNASFALKKVNVPQTTTPTPNPSYSGTGSNAVGMANVGVDLSGITKLMGGGPTSAQTTLFQNAAKALAARPDQAAAIKQRLSDQIRGKVPVPG